MTTLEHRNHFSLGAHAEENIRATDRIYRQLRSYIEQGYTIDYYLESAFLSPSIADLIGSLQQEGLAPSNAFATGVFVENYGRLPTSREELEVYKEEELFVGSAGKFNKAELAMLDGITRFYPGKVALHVESQTQEEYLNIPEKYRDAGRETRQEAIRLMSEGKFDEAMVPFKECARALHAVTGSRDASFERRILATSDEDKVTFVRIGAAHTALAHAVKKEHKSTLMDFDNKKDGIYRFDPFESLLRTMYYYGEENISDLEWYQAMLGFMLGHINEVLLDGVSPDHPMFLDDQERTMLIIENVEYFLYDMEEVRKFESLVRESDFLTATTNFMQFDSEEDDDVE